MSNSHHSRRKVVIWSLLAVILIIIVGIGVLLSPIGQNYRAQQAQAFIDAAKNEPKQSTRLVDYQFAHLLDRTNEQTQLLLAAQYSQVGKYDEAHAVLSKLHSSQARILSSQIYAEQNNYAAALEAVRGPVDASERLQYVAMAKLAGNNDAVATTATNAPITERTKLAALATGNLPLAEYLYENKMYSSAIDVAGKATESAQKYIVVSSSYILQGSSSTQLSAAQKAAQTGIALDPSNVTLHKLLHLIYTQRNDATGAAKEQTIITNLEKGTL